MAPVEPQQVIQAPTSNSVAATETELVVKAFLAHAAPENGDIPKASAAWRSFSTALTNLISGDPNQPGLDSFDAIAQKLRDWKGAAADEFRKQASVVRKFGMDTAQKADALSGDAFGPAMEWIAGLRPGIQEEHDRLAQLQKDIANFIYNLSRNWTPHSQGDIPAGCKYTIENTYWDGGLQQKGFKFTLDTPMGNYLGDVTWNGVGGPLHAGFWNTVLVLQDTASGESKPSIETTTLTSDWITKNFTGSYLKALQPLADYVSSIYADTTPRLPEAPDKSHLPNFSPQDNQNHNNQNQYGTGTSGPGSYGSGPGLNPAVSGSGFNSPTGASGYNPKGTSGYNPTGTTAYHPSGTSGYSPGSFGPGSYNPGTYGSGYDPGSKLASFDPNGVGGLGGNGLYTPGAGSGLGGVGSGAGSSGAGGTGGGLGTGGVAGEGAGGLGAAGAAGRGGMPMVPPMGGQGGNKDGKDRQRNAWLNEDEDVWGANGDEGSGVL